MGTPNINIAAATTEVAGPPVIGAVGHVPSGMAAGPNQSPRTPPSQPAPSRIVLGIDPGLNITGYAVIACHEGGRGIGAMRIEEAGVVRSRRRDALPERLAEIHHGVSEVLAAHAVTLVALEQLFSHYQRPRTAILMGHARGVICLAAASAGVAVRHLEPTRVKKMMTGNGRAPKSQIQDAVRWQLGLDAIPEPADVADAMAIALCGQEETLAA